MNYSFCFCYSALLINLKYCIWICSKINFFLCKFFPSRNAFNAFSLLSISFAALFTVLIYSLISLTCGSNLGNSTLLLYHCNTTDIDLVISLLICLGVISTYARLHNFTFCRCIQLARKFLRNKNIQSFI